jgi:hypothetical protein
MSALVQYLNFLKLSSAENRKKEKTALELQGYAPSENGEQDNPNPDESSLENKIKSLQPTVTNPNSVPLSGASSAKPAITTPVSNPARGYNTGVPAPQHNKQFTKIPRVLEKLPDISKPTDPREGTLLSKRAIAYSRNTGIADVDGGLFVNNEDVELLGKLGFEVEGYTELEKTSEVLDLYAYIEKVAGVPKEVAKLVDEGKAFSGEYLKEMEYSVPEGYEVKGDLCCPVEKTASMEKQSAERPGLWANIHAKRKRGEKAAKPGDEDYPDKKQWDKLSKESAASPAWQRSEGKNPEGGLNAKGRASYKKQTGGTLKAPVTESNPKGDRAKRQNSFCSRMCGMKRVNTGSKAQSDPDSRINKSLRKWNCKCGEDHSSLFEKIGCVLKSSEATYPLKSSNIRAVGYDKPSKSLDVAFHSGSEYKYLDVPKTIFDRIKRVKSPGKFFNKHVKLKEYPYEKTAAMPDHIRKAILTGDKAALRAGQKAAVKSRARNKAKSELRKFLDMGEEAAPKKVHLPSEYKTQTELNLKYR